MTTLVINRAWLKHSSWDLFDWQVGLEDVNISDTDYDIIAYQFDNNIKILASLKKQKRVCI